MALDHRYRTIISGKHREEIAPPSHLTATEKKRLKRWMAVERDTHFAGFLDTSPSLLERAKAAKPVLPRPLVPEDFRDPDDYLAAHVARQVAR